MVDSELMRYASGEVKPRSEDRAVTARAKKFYDKVREADFQARGIIALTADVMDGMADLDAHRKKLAQDDPGLNTLLAQMELTAADQVGDIIRGVHKPVRRMSW